MSEFHNAFSALIRCLIFSWIMTFPLAVKADDDEIISGVCEDMAAEEIPVGDFAEIAMPQTPANINQEYNTSYEDGYSFNDKWYYGHTGLDTEGDSDVEGVNDVYAILPGMVILSKEEAQTGGWGESIIIATLSNEYSSQIITHHYHHMYATEPGSDYITTREFNACESVLAGELIGKEGDTGNSHGSHMHITVRRWQNLEELKVAISAGVVPLFGPGYTYGDNTKLTKNLDPQGLIFNTFLDYQWESGHAPAYAWSLPFALKMRSHGIDFGLYDGTFGADTTVTKRDLARWLKIAAKRQNHTPATATFSDLPLTDDDSVYIESLVRFPEGHPVFDPNHSCQSGSKKFCPDSTVNRAEALKTIVMAFYGDEFISDYDQNIWNNTYLLAIQLLDIFTDVPVIAWYAPYVYFGVKHNLVTQQDIFAPEEPIRKEQLAKWIITGMEHLEGISQIPCGNNPCLIGYYCSSPENTCHKIPDCMPSEGLECDVGGGYEEPQTPPPDDTAPPTPACAAGYTKCQSDCCDNASEVCFEGAACYCYNTFLDCGNGVCRDTLTDNANCGGCGNVCDQGETCTGGYCIPGQQCECTNQTCCDGCNYKPDLYTASASQACYGNPQGVGTPTLCLETQKVNGPNFKSRVCKQGGTYQSQFTHQLKDNNNLVNFTKLNGTAGASCTGWQNFEVSYIGYGASKSAGLQAEVISPAGCTGSTCKYKTGTITVTKTCN